MSEPKPAPEDEPVPNYGISVPPDDHLRPKRGTPEYQKAREQQEKEDRANGAAQYLEDLLDLAD